jgi:hypothetical protein
MSRAMDEAGNDEHLIQLAQKEKMETVYFKAIFEDEKAAAQGTRLLSELMSQIRAVKTDPPDQWLNDSPLVEELARATKLTSSELGSLLQPLQNGSQGVDHIGSELRLFYHGESDAEVWSALGQVLQDHGALETGYAYQSDLEINWFDYVPTESRKS